MGKLGLYGGALVLCFLCSHFSLKTWLDEIANNRFDNLTPYKLLLTCHLSKQTS